MAGWKIEIPRGPVRLATRCAVCDTQPAVAMLSAKQLVITGYYIVVITHATHRWQTPACTECAAKHRLWDLGVKLGGFLLFIMLLVPFVAQFREGDTPAWLAVAVKSAGVAGVVLGAVSYVARARISHALAARYHKDGSLTIYARHQRFASETAALNEASVTGP